MSSIFVDRESAYPNRYRLIPESGAAYYAVLERADEPVAPGTPLNAETFNQMREEISDEIKALTPEQIGAVPVSVMVSSFFLVDDEDGIDTSIDKVFDTFELTGCTPRRFRVRNDGLSLAKGLWFVTPYKDDDYNKFVVAIQSNSYGVDIMYRSCHDGEWQPWGVGGTRT